MELLLQAVVTMALSEFVIRVNVLQIPRLFWYFLFGLTECCCWYQHSDSYTGKCMSVWRDIVTLNTDKNNNVRHTLSLWNRTRCDTKDNVWPDFQKCRYFIYTCKWSACLKFVLRPVNRSNISFNLITKGLLISSV